MAFCWERERWRGKGGEEDLRPRDRLRVIGAFDFGGEGDGGGGVGGEGEEENAGEGEWVHGWVEW